MSKRGSVTSYHDRRCITHPFVSALWRAGARHRPLLLPLRTGADASTADAAASAGMPAEASTLVDQVLELIKDSDGGDLVTPENRKTVDAALEQLDAIGDAAVSPRPCTAPPPWTYAVGRGTQADVLVLVAAGSIAVPCPWHAPVRCQHSLCSLPARTPARPPPRPRRCARWTTP